MKKLQSTDIEQMQKEIQSYCGFLGKSFSRGKKYRKSFKEVKYFDKRRY